MNPTKWHALTKSVLLYKYLRWIVAEKKMLQNFLLRTDRQTDTHTRVKRYTPPSPSYRGYNYLWINFFIKCTICTFKLPFMIIHDYMIHCKNWEKKIKVVEFKVVWRLCLSCVFCKHSEIESYSEHTFVKKNLDRHQVSSKTYWDYM